MESCIMERYGSKNTRIPELLRRIRIAAFVGWSLLLLPVIGFLAFAVVAIAPSAPAIAQQRTPELIPGKKTLYQRVLTRTGNSLRAGASPQAPAVSSQLAPMTILYVFGRRNVDGREWLELGSSRNRADGWLPAEQTLEWNQTLTAEFQSTGDRNRALFFRRAEDLKRQFSAQNAKDELSNLIRLADRGALPEDSPILALEPPEPPGRQAQFYIQPILEVRDLQISPRQTAKILKIASETVAGDDALLGPGTRSFDRGYVPADGLKLSGFRTGVVFVIDTSSSMQPYIDRVRAGMKSLYQRIARSSFGGNVAFGMVAFRSDIRKTPALVYNTDRVAPLSTAAEGDRFLRDIAKVAATDVSSDSFDEDSFAGVKRAVDEMNWSGFDGRFIILITDAGSKEGRASFSNSYSDDLRNLAQAQERPISLIAIHLLTPSGARNNNHDHAREQYRQLTGFSQANAYFPVEGGSTDLFAAQINNIADIIERQVADAYAGRLIPQTDFRASADPLDSMRSRLDMLGRSMQLQFLGRVGNRQAPRLIEAWVADRDPDKSRPNVVKVNALITKNQQSQIVEALETVLRKGEETRGNSKDFFNQLRSVPAIVTRTPQEVDSAKIERIVQFGGLDEYLEGLPYKSQLMEMTEQRWISMQISEQRELLDRLQAKIELYRSFNADRARWVDLERTPSDPGDDVMQIPLDSLP